MKIVRFLTLIALACAVRSLSLLALAGAVISLHVTVALADTIAATSSIDFSTIANILLPIVFTAIAALLSKLVLVAMTRAGVQNAAAISAMLDPLMAEGLAAAQSALSSRIATEGLSVDVKSALVSTAAQYVINHAADQLKAANIDGAKLGSRLAALISLNTTPPESSIAVVTPPAPVVTTIAPAK